MPSPEQVNRKWLQVVLGHARRNRDVTEVPLLPPFYLLFRPALRHICTRYLDGTFYSFSGGRKTTRTFFNTLFSDGFTRPCLAHLPARAGEFHQQTEGREKVICWHRACLQVHLVNKPAWSSIEEGRGGGRTIARG